MITYVIWIVGTHFVIKYSILSEKGLNVGWCKQDKPYLKFDVCM